MWPPNMLAKRRTANTPLLMNVPPNSMRQIIRLSPKPKIEPATHASISLVAGSFFTAS